MAQKYYVPAFPKDQTSGSDSYTAIFEGLGKVKPGPMTKRTDRTRNSEAFHKKVAPIHASSSKIEPQAPKSKGVPRTGRQEDHNSQAKPVTGHETDPSLRDRRITSKDQTPRSTGGSRGSSQRRDYEIGEQEVIVPPFPNCNEPNVDYSGVFNKARTNLISPSPYPTGRERGKSPGLKWYNIIGRCIHWFSKLGPKSQPVNSYKKV